MGCYYYGNNEVTGLQQAFRTCVSLGGYLLNINAELEHNHTVDRLKDLNRRFDGYWIGGLYDGQFWVWQKTLPSGVVVNTYMDPGRGYYKWGPFQPNDGLRYRQFAVAIMTRGRPVPYMWYSEYENMTTNNGMSYICEADWIEI